MVGLPVLILLASGLALATALVAQYVFGLDPCALCVWQRWPYVAALGIGLLGWVFRLPVWLVALAGFAAFAATAGVGMFHAGVEQGWWQGLATCAGADTPDTVEALRAQLMGKQPARCDAIPFSFLGLSIAGWNVVYAGGMALLTLYLGFRRCGGRI